MDFQLQRDASKKKHELGSSQIVSTLRLFTPWFLRSVYVRKCSMYSDMDVLTCVIFNCTRLNSKEDWSYLCLLWRFSMKAGRWMHRHKVWHQSTETVKHLWNWGFLLVIAHMITYKTHCVLTLQTLHNQTWANVVSCTQICYRISHSSV